MVLIIKRKYHPTNLTWGWATGIAEKYGDFPQEEVEELLASDETLAIHIPPRNKRLFYQSDLYYSLDELVQDVRFLHIFEVCHKFRRQAVGSGQGMSVWAAKNIAYADKVEPARVSRRLMKEYCSDFLTRLDLTHLIKYSDYSIEKFGILWFNLLISYCLSNPYSSNA